MPTAARVVQPPT